MKFADYPVVMVDVYGRERHSEYTRGEYRDEETYLGRMDRANLMIRTFQYIADGIPPDNRLILIDRDQELLTNRARRNGTVATAQYGARSQGGWIIDFNGKIIQTQVWQRPEQNDELLSQMFGLEPGF